MITNPFVLALLSFGICGLVTALAKRRALRPFFAAVPVVIFVFFTPTALRTLGLIPGESSFYDFTARYAFPAALLIFVASGDIRLVLQMGRPAAVAFAVGAASIAIAAPVIYYFFDPIGTEDGWKGLAVMSSALIGGFPNMLAVNESIECRESLFGSMVMATSVLIYGWMWLLIACKPIARSFDRITNADATIIDSTSCGLHVEDDDQPSVRVVSVTCFAIAGLSVLLMAFGRILPTLGPVVTGTTWGMLLLLVSGLLLSCTSIVKRMQCRLATIGLFGVYVVLFTIGAKANFADLSQVPRILFFGMTLIAVHFVATLIVAVWMKYPFVLAVTASMANIGGVLSAPVVATAYDRRLAISGVLMGLLGSIAGTPLGFLIAQMLSFVSK